MLLPLLHTDLPLPAFFPDGTYGVVRSLDARDLQEAGVAGVVMNVFHLMSKPGINAVKQLGGLHKLTGWPGAILTDSGGFQVFSMLDENASLGEVRKDAIIFKPPGESKIIFSPEKCIQAQFSCGSDIIMCLDYCIHPNSPPELNQRSVDTTIRWARKCREEFDLQIDRRYGKAERRPQLFAIIQGGADREMRRRCAEELKELGFAGYGFGGWPIDSEGRLLEDILAYTAELMPDDLPKYAMGLGRPEEIVACVKMGYNLFDCVKPTREARRNRLYIFNEEKFAARDLTGSFYEYVNIVDQRFYRDERPISSVCDCYCCANFSRAYLRHLFKVGDTLAYRLATIHNLRFFSQLMEVLRGQECDQS